MRQRMMRIYPIAACSWGAAIVSVMGVINLNGQPAFAQTQNLTQQLTIHLNSGTRSRDRDQADELIGVGKTQATNGDWAGAIASWQRAQQIYQQLGDMDGQGVAFGYLAIAYQQQGQTAAQEDTARRQLAVTRDQRDFNGQITASNSLGRVLAPRAGGTSAAGELFIEAMDVATSVRSEAEERQAVNNLTWLANSLDQPEQNARLLETATLPPDQRYANPSSLGLKLGVHGAQWIDQRRFFMATRFHTIAHDLAAQDGNSSLQLLVMEDLITSHLAMGRYDIARDWLDQRLALARSLNDSQEELATLAFLGEINLAIGRTAVAQRYFEQALTVAEGLNDAQQTTILRERLAGFEQP